jgi:F-box protein 11
MSRKREITVSKGFFSRFKTIGDAITAASPGTVIYIEPGVYEENLFINKPLELIGKGRPEDVVITGDIMNEDTTIDVNADRVRICGITILQKGKSIEKDFYYSAVDLGEGSVLIENCSIISAHGNGIHVMSERSQPTIQHCKIYNSAGHGIYVQIFGNITVIDCEIYNNQQSGITFDSEGAGIFENCYVYGNGDANIHISNGSPEILGCKIYGSQYGIQVDQESKGSIANCDIFNNKLANIHLENNAEPVVQGCKLYSSGEFGVSVSNKALGTFTNCDIYDNECSNVLIEDEGDPEFTYCNIFNSNEHGIYSYGGWGTFYHCDIYNNRSSNILIEAEAEPTISNSKIYNSGENGVEVDEEGYGTFENCEIYSNGREYHNVAIFGGGNPVFRDCIIYDSEDCNIWIDDGGLGLFENCEIYDCNSPNIIIENEGNPQIKGCKIYNSTTCGVWVLNNGRGMLANCVIYDTETPIISEEGLLEILDSSENKQAESITRSKSPNGQAVSADLSAVLEELNSLIGLDNVKEQIAKIVEFTKFNKELASFGIAGTDAKAAVSHTVLFGNPGTGKTTVARMLGQIYKAMGLLSSGHLVQVNREKLVGEYIGTTAPKTKKKIDEAMGGVLFIDEAYELTNKGMDRDFGPEAIAVILEEMENRRGEFMVVVAGYEGEMESFIDSNPGLKSRFTQYFHLKDYTPDELARIAQKMAKDQNRQLSPAAEQLLHKQFTFLWRKRDKFFSNARTVRNYIDGMLQAQAQRCMQVPKEQWTKELILTLTPEDVKAVLPKEETEAYLLPINEEHLAEALHLLNRMIGMSRIKAEIEKLITLVRYYREEGRDVSELSPHTLLVGNPGTGKTEVARIIAQIYEALGILERGDLIEVKRENLVSPYPGESERLISEYIDRAMGGTLFIDEAYQLTQYGPQDPGHTVIEVLLKRMEDDRGEFIVLAAGYKEHMEQFLDSNPGLGRRFNRMLEFEDYTPSELLQISELMLSDRGYMLSDGARDVLFDCYEQAYAQRDHSFGNAGYARNMVNEMISNIDYRVAKMPKEQRTPEIMHTVQAEDLNLISPPAL